MQNTQEKFIGFYLRYQKIFLLLIALIVIFFRRPGQILHPYIWCEDGSIILRQYLNNGLLSILKPVQGYYILSSKIINFLSYFISFWYYPEIAAFLANAFIIAVVFAIAYSPTNLKYPWLCAVLTLFVKTDAECFSVALYSFWWAGLLLILATLWKDKCKIKLQFLYLLIGGFSSPLICIASPILCAKAIIKKKKTYIYAAVVSLLPFFVQAITINKNSAVNNMSIFDLNEKMIIKQFFGRYIIQGSIQIESPIYLFVGLGLLSILIFPVIEIAIFKRKNMAYNVLFIWLCSSIVMSVYRVPLEIIHPFFAGPRYFFYPFIVIAWMLVWILGLLRESSFFFVNHSNNHFIVKIRYWVYIGIIVTFLFTFFINGSLLYMRRDHVAIDWRHELSNAMASNEPYELPIHVRGYDTPWSITITAQQCQRLIKKSLLFRNYQGRAH